MNKKREARKYMNPYLGGVLLGLVLLTAIYISGRGLGANGAFKSCVTATVNTVTPDHVVNSVYYKDQLENNSNPLKNWLVFQVMGVLIGGFISGVLSRRLKFKIEHSPKISSRKRIILALIGGVLFAFGADLARGCTSGAALSGMAVLSLHGFITMIAIFGSAFALAYFFRKNWI